MRTICLNVAVSDCCIVDMGTERRQILELGVLGRVPVDSLFELYVDTNDGQLLTVYQTKCPASLGGWVSKQRPIPLEFLACF